MTSDTALPLARKPVPLSVWAGLAFAIIVDTALQLVWSKTVKAVPHEAGTVDTLLGMLHQPTFYLMLCINLAQFINWMILLSKADLSFAQPITAFAYVTTAIGSWWFLHDHITAPRMIGIGLILIGVWLISRTHHHTGVPSPVHPVTDSLEAP